eukprot:TRINITY_DN1553_c0_g1_i1.p2 TRINITY_DN1553_c0_g1~~TRINITY_DN1553_c0_g1_i1.p2  ORF type:complete len:177 (-),score=46.38 TRINITY_DN1553_c0_g1_i1:30-560(-)
MESDEEGLVIPAGSPLQLKKTVQIGSENDLDIEDLEVGDLGDDLNDLSRASSTTSTTLSNAIDDEEDVEEYTEPEEEWDDVEIPANGKLGEPVTKRVTSAIQQQQQTRSGVPQQLKTTNTEKEEWDDFELPAQLVLKPGLGGKRPASTSAKKQEDEWEGLDVSNLQAKLNAKFGKK